MQYIADGTTTSIVISAHLVIHSLSQRKIQMTQTEFDNLRVGSWVYCPFRLQPNVGSTIPPNTKHVVVDVDRRRADLPILVTKTVDEAKVDCAFTKAMALQLLQISSV